MIPVHAVGAVGGMADSGVVMGMTRGRLWIAVLGVLLGGIVALNVWGLGLSASTSGTSTKIDEFERANTVLEAQIAKRASSDRVQALAAGLGLETPTPKAVRYLKVRGGDAAAAAQRLTSGEVSVLAGLPIAPEFAEATLAPAATPEPAAPAVEPVVPAVPAVGAEATTPAPVPPADPAAAPAAAPATATPAPLGDGGLTP